MLSGLGVWTTPLRAHYRLSRESRFSCCRIRSLVRGHSIGACVEILQFHDANTPWGLNAQSEQQGGILLPTPCPETRLFRYAATRPVLNLLADTPTVSYTIRNLHRATDHSLDNVRQAATRSMGTGSTTPSL